MAEIIAEEATGSSKKSLTRALADAIKSALKSVDGNHELNITVVIEGLTFENGEYKVSVKVLVMDVTLEKEKAYQESQDELTNRMDANQDLSEQMVAAIYARPIYDNSTPVDALEQRMDSMADQSSQFDFDANQDSITLIAPQSFHDQMRQDYNAQLNQNDLNTNAPSLDLGGGSSPSPNDKDIA